MQIKMCQPNNWLLCANMRIIYHSDNVIFTILLTFFTDIEIFEQSFYRLKNIQVKYILWQLSWGLGLLGVLLFTVMYIRVCYKNQKCIWIIYSTFTLLCIKVNKRKMSFWQQFDFFS